MSKLNRYHFKRVKKLDAITEIVAAQIAHIQTFKKGLLQQMFV